MKKKQIEQIPYKKIVSIPKGYKYLAIAFVKNISHERVLFIDVYSKENKKAPVLRSTYSQKDWGSYIPGTEDSWRQARIKDEYATLRWAHTYDRNAKTYISEEDAEKVMKFCKKRPPRYSNANWIDYIEHQERAIKWEKESRARDRKKEALDNRCRNVPELPKDFDSWIEDEIFEKWSFIYYKRKGRYATFFCSHCGKEYTYATQARDTFEGAFEHIVAVPSHNQLGRCEKCDHAGIFKAAGKTKDVWCKTEYAYIGQPYGESGAVIRYYQIDKIFKPDEVAKYIKTEIARSFYEEGKRVQTDFHKYSGYTGRYFWDYCNLGGMSNIKLSHGHIYPGTWQQLSETCLKYSGAEEYVKNYDTENLVHYMTAYHDYPSIEILSKLGMYKMVNALINNSWSVDVVKMAKTPEAMFKIGKRELRILIREHGEPETLRVLQLEHSLGQQWTEEQREAIQSLHADKNKMRLALSVMSVQQFINRVEKYAGASFDASCMDAWNQIKHMATTYLDYLDMRSKRGYDLSNSIIAFPRDILEEHQKMVLETEKEKVDARMKEVEERFGNIKKHYRRNFKKYHFEDDEFIIRPARSASEIVIEGRVLHHCVGGDSYLRKHNEDESFILMLRSKEHEDIPYITVEIQGTKIVQWYGAHDKKPDEDRMQKWLDQYITRLKCQGTQNIEDADLIREVG